MTIFLVRSKVLKEAFEEPDFVEKWDRCVNLKCCEKVLVEWCKKKGIVVADVNCKLEGGVLNVK